MDAIADRLMAHAGWLRKYRGIGCSLTAMEVALLSRDLEQCAEAIRDVAADALRRLGVAPQTTAPPNLSASRADE